jgi:hypothetical protein
VAKSPRKTFSEWIDEKVTGKIAKTWLKTQQRSQLRTQPSRRLWESWRYGWEYRDGWVYDGEPSWVEGREDGLEHSWGDRRETVKKRGYEHDRGAAVKTVMMMTQNTAEEEVEEIARNMAYDRESGCEDGRKDA